jgi:hypothetical protein
MPIIDKLKSMLILEDGGVARIPPSNFATSDGRPLWFSDQGIYEKKDIKDKIIDKLKMSINSYFDYTFTDIGEIIIYIRPKIAGNDWEKTENDSALKYTPMSTITITPKDDEISLAVKTNDGSKFDSQGLKWRTKKKLDDDKIIKIISDKINTLMMNLKVK